MKIVFFGVLCTLVCFEGHWKSESLLLTHFTFKGTTGDVTSKLTWHNESTFPISVGCDFTRSSVICLMLNIRIWDCKLTLAQEKKQYKYCWILSVYGIIFNTVTFSSCPEIYYKPQSSPAMILLRDYILTSVTLLWHALHKQVNKYKHYLSDKKLSVKGGAPCMIVSCSVWGFVLLCFVLFWEVGSGCL